MNRRDPLGTPYQEGFLADLRELQRESPKTLVQVARGALNGDLLKVRLRLATGSMSRSPGGMEAHDIEDLVVLIPSSPLAPPVVGVTHDRFLGVPHVLSDGQLCVYLDPAREWNPLVGARGFLDRLFRWFEDALADRFDADTALFHAVGGLQYAHGNAEPVVCREEFDDPRRLSLAWLSRHGANARLDLHRTQRRPEDERVLVLRMPGPLYTGAGRSVYEVLRELGEPDAASALRALQARVARRRSDEAGSVHLVVNVPHPASTVTSLLVGQVDLRDAADMSVCDRPIEWCRLYDERPSISTRRDKDRPVNAFHQSDVVILGCGGLGSWIAEYLVRAGCRSINLVDYGAVSGGHLVRQNFTEADVTDAKASALAEHLRAINPDLKVTASVGSTLSPDALDVLTGGGFIIDATVSNAMATYLSLLDVSSFERRAFVAQVATDVATGSLGMVVVAAPGTEVPTVDTAAGVHVTATGELEAYRTFWEVSEDDELVPARGCSVPTFHGSAADLAAVAAIQINIIGRHAGQQTSGTYLFALPHTGVAPGYVFLPHQSDTSG
ncbi:ThiF family adenylyltransferase [Cellulomonas wangsupingiae]|uniref:ThiF family adenylyltransferase n=1 Tax=Cellulomonas wangsupingiae TaxID=2968085 RepID=A0ABY5K573_9CELL|nr:ThiF family adenylyltransferase [Cellulomonas wangsupingiae]MCC2335104.1 ThiF family adenylyltransferase [Cellulomonas wangsupingiae]UUI65599.1 ThiF family adenylyltransferase [Cellulomonas wangsupingiae]